MNQTFTPPYQSPEMELIQIRCEQGFAESEIGGTQDFTETLEDIEFNLM